MFFATRKRRNMLLALFVRGYHHRSLTKLKAYYAVNVISHYKLKGVEIFLYLYGEADGMQATNKEIISAPLCVIILSYSQFPRR